MEKIPGIPYQEFRAKYLNKSFAELETDKKILEIIVYDQGVIVEYLKREGEDEKAAKEELKLRNLKGELNTLENMLMRRWVEECHKSEPPE